VVQTLEQTNKMLLSKERQPVKKPQSSPLTLILVALLVVLAGATVFKAMTPKPVVQTINVVGAGQDILPGTRISYNNLHYVTVPASFDQEGLFAKNNMVVGRIARTFISKGEPLHDTSLLKPGQTLSQELETHERAISLKLDDEALVDHGITGGDKVDVIFTATKEGKKYTKTICQNLPVIFSLPKEAVKSKSLQGHDASRITLAVTPEQAEILSQAEETGRIRLVLRNRLSTVEPKSYGIAEDDLLPAKAHQTQPSLPAAPVSVPFNSNLEPALPQALAVPPPPPLFDLNQVKTMPEVKKAADWVVEVFTGNRRETHEFPRSQ